MNTGIIIIAIMVGILLTPFVLSYVMNIDRKQKAEESKTIKVREESIAQDELCKAIARLILPPDLYGLYLINTGKGKQNRRKRIKYARGYANMLG